MRRPDTPEQQIPATHHPAIDHDGVDWPEQVYAPLDADRMCLAVARARQFHLIRIAGSEEAITRDLRDTIIGQPAWYPVQRQGGWWHVGSVLDAHDGLMARMIVRWHPETDRVRIDRPPVRDFTAPRPETPCPIVFDSEFKPIVEEGWIYWHQGEPHDAQQARRLLLRETNRALLDWSWEPILD